MAITTNRYVLWRLLYDPQATARLLESGLNRGPTDAPGELEAADDLSTVAEANTDRIGNELPLLRTSTRDVVLMGWLPGVRADALRRRADGSTGVTRAEGSCLAAAAMRRGSTGSRPASRAELAISAPRHCKSVAAALRILSA